MSNLIFDLCDLICQIVSISVHINKLAQPSLLCLCLTDETVIKPWKEVSRSLCCFSFKFYFHVIGVSAASESFNSDFWIKWVLFQITFTVRYVNWSLMVRLASNGPSHLAWTNHLDAMIFRLTNGMAEENNIVT